MSKSSEEDATFNFLASLINGNTKTKRIKTSRKTFNFLASLINGNYYSEQERAATM